MRQHKQQLAEADVGQGNFGNARGSFTVRGSGHSAGKSVDHGRRTPCRMVFERLAACET
jgi:hypothetical protein